MPKPTALDNLLTAAAEVIAASGNLRNAAVANLKVALAALDASEPDAWCCPVHPERRYNRQVACDVAIMDPNHSAYREPCGALMVALYARSRHE